MLPLAEVLPFYIGAPVSTPDGVGLLVGLPWTREQQFVATVQFNNPVLTSHAVDGKTQLLRSHGDYLIRPLNLEPAQGPAQPTLHLSQGIVLLLRSTNSIAPEEMRELMILMNSIDATNPLYSAKLTQWYTRNYFDVFGLIKAGLALDQITFNTYRNVANN